MTSPVTSTRVATNGAEALAGLRPHRRRTNGSVAPAIEPNATTPIRLHKIVNARKYRLRAVKMKKRLPGEDADQSNDPQNASER